MKLNLKSLLVKGAKAILKKYGAVAIDRVEQEAVERIGTAADAATNKIHKEAAKARTKVVKK